MPSPSTITVHPGHTSELNIDNVERATPRARFNNHLQGAAIKEAVAKALAKR
jgi:hypothetical protein